MRINKDTTFSLIQFVLVQLGVIGITCLAVVSFFYVFGLGRFE